MARLWGLWIAALPVLLSTTGMQRPKVSQAWVVESGSSLLIEGSSNVNPFRCVVSRYLGSDTIRCDNDGRTRRLMFSRRRVHIDVHEIDCAHRFITADLRRTLKYPEHPYLMIDIVSLEDPTAVAVGQVVRGVVDIEIAGRVKRMEMSYTVKARSGDRYRLEGSRELSFPDFGLEAPRKLAGLIRINDELRVTAQFLFRKIAC